jgi:hypothetical protein
LKTIISLVHSPVRESLSEMDKLILAVDRVERKIDSLAEEQRAHNEVQNQKLNMIFDYISGDSQRGKKKDTDEEHFKMPLLPFSSVEEVNVQCRTCR